MTRSFRWIVALAAVAGLGGCAVYPDAAYSNVGYSNVGYSNVGYGSTTYLNTGVVGGYGTAGTVIAQPYVVEQSAPIYIYGGQTYRRGYGGYRGRGFVAPPVYGGRPHVGGRPGHVRPPGSPGHVRPPGQARPPQDHRPGYVAPAPNVRPPGQAALRRERRERGPLGIDSRSGN